MVPGVVSRICPVSSSGGSRCWDQQIIRIKSSASGHTPIHHRELIGKQPSPPSLSLHLPLLITPTWLTIAPESSSSCSSDQYQCEQGQCIPDRWLCDDYPDCPFGDDEENCFTTDYGTTEGSSCPDDQYECLNGVCIPSYWVCDGYPDCLDADDEDDCNSSTDYSTGDSGCRS